MCPGVSYEDRLHSAMPIILRISNLKKRASIFRPDSRRSFVFLCSLLAERESLWREFTMPLESQWEYRFPSSKLVRWQEEMLLLFLSIHAFFGACPWINDAFEVVNAVTVHCFVSCTTWPSRTLMPSSAVMYSCKPSANKWGDLKIAVDDFSRHGLQAACLYLSKWGETAGKIAVF